MNSGEDSSSVFQSCGDTALSSAALVALPSV
jgi:hypothetical protein